MALNAKLVVVGGDVKTEEIKLRLPSTIGRGKGTTIMLAHPLVSRQHCELFEAGGQLMVKDLGSLNGTFVNNQKISEAPLPPGELLTIGTVTFRAVYELQDEMSPPKGTSPQVKSGNKPPSSAETLRANPKAPSRPPPQDDVEFDFDKPLMGLDELDTPGHSTRRLETPAAGSPVAKPPEKKSPEKKAPEKKPSERRPAAANPAKPAPAPAKAPPAKPASPGRGEAATIDFKNRKDDDEDEHVASSSDEDLDDFLKSLEK